MFDWIRFLDAHRIEYDLERRDNVKIKCPLCGDDPSKHLGISLTGAGWNCWRNKNHRGRSPVGLIQVLLKCTWEEARSIAGLDTGYIPDDALSKAMTLLRPPAVCKPKLLKLPPEFNDLSNAVRSRPYVRYLSDRGFSVHDAFQYRVLHCTTGPYRGRIIFPVTFAGQLVSWTGRHVGNILPRYRSHTHDPEKAKADGYEPAHGPINNYLLWYDDLVRSRAHTLVLCEGPMDAFKVMVLGRNHGVVATCMFGAEPTATQIDLLYELTPRFERRVLLLDRGTLAKTVEVTSKLKLINVEPGKMTLRKDPGELRDVKELWQTLGLS